ncbi:glycosyltransferase family 4 protein [Spirosoma gilvum]
MQITYLFRSPGTGYSIEALFETIQQTTSQRPGIRTKRVQLPHVSRNLWRVGQNLNFIRRLRADVFHITGDCQYAALALPASRTILTIHDCGPLKKFQNHPLRYAVFWWLWYYLPVRRLRWITVVSEKTRQELIHYVGRVGEKAVVVANGYDPAFVYAPAAFRAERPVLLQVGTAPNKNLTNLIDALEGINCTLVIVGTLTSQLTTRLQNHRIDYQNYIDLSRAELIEWYTYCDIVTFLSTYEGFGMPVLEANAIGRVVLTSAIAPMLDVAPGAAHFVDPTDPAAIRQGVLRLIQDSVYRQRLIDVGRENAQRYSIDKAADQYVAIYQKIVSPNRSAEPIA